MFQVDLAVLLAFVPAGLALNLTPGADMMFCLGQGLKSGRRAAMAATPALIKAYLRLGGFVGDGAWIDRAFNTTDVCLVMDTGQMSARHREFYIRKAGP